MTYRAEIDGLRALAVLPVIFFHAGFSIFSGGYVGVDVFFVISGYLITSIIITEINAKKFSIVNFYERRARRILPALFWVSFICFPFAWLLFTPNDLRDFGQSLLAVSTFSSNILFFLESGYFENSAELKPLLHTWSLAVEEQYYIFFPLLLSLLWKFGVKRILAVLILIFLASLGYAHVGINNNPSASFYLLHTRIWELLLGAFIAFYLHTNSFIKSKPINQILSLSGALMIIYSIITFDENTPFPSLYSLVPTIGTGFLILSALPNTLAYRLLTLKPIVFIGLISYSIYLWHQPLLAFVKYQYYGDLSESLLFLICLLSIFMGWLSWQYIEKPFRDKNYFSRKTIFQISLTGMILLSLIGIILDVNEGFSSRVQFSNALSNSFLRPSSAGCFDTSMNHSAKNWGCFLGAKKNGVDFLLFGDSHSLSLINAIDNIASEKGLSVFYTGSNGCLPFLGIQLVGRNDQNENNCKLLNERVLEFSKQNMIKGIIFSARWAYYTNGDYENKNYQLVTIDALGNHSLQSSINAFNKGFNQTIDEYNSLGIHVNIISQPPHQKYHPEKSYFKIAKGIADIKTFSVSRLKFEKLEKTYMEIFSSRANEYNLYHIINNFCDEEKCYLGNSEVSYYFDEDHISNDGAKLLQAEIYDILSS